MQPTTSLPGASKLTIALAAAAMLSACATSQDPATRTDGINDPYERQNRAIHEFNKDLDTVIVRPVSRAYAVVPPEMRDRVNDFSENLSMPGVAINSLLQGDLRGVGLATTRFVMNTTIGIVGLVDAASEFGIPEHDTDFGETLAVWGVGEGAYIELPVFGPSTQRDAVGFFTDFFTNPLTFATLDDDPERFIPPTTRGLAVLNDRDRLSTTIDAILYESADSYAQTRSIFLQNRRFELEGSAVSDIDPFQDEIDPFTDEIDPFTDDIDPFTDQ